MVGLTIASFAGGSTTNMSMETVSSGRHTLRVYLRNHPSGHVGSLRFAHVTVWREESDKRPDYSK